MSGREKEEYAFDRTFAFWFGILGCLSNAYGLIVSIFSNSEFYGTEHIWNVSIPVVISLIVNIAMWIVGVLVTKKYFLYLTFVVLVDGGFLFPFMLKSCGYLFLPYYLVLAVIVGAAPIIINPKKLSPGKKLAVRAFGGLAPGLAVLYYRMATSFFRNTADIAMGTLPEVEWKHILPIMGVFAVVSFSLLLMLNELSNMRDDLVKTKEVLETKSIKDELTGAYNRSGLKEDLASKADKIQSVIFMDIDKFKEVNDTYGHDTGDSCLRTFASIMYPYRSYDFQLYRYGGDEFVILSLLSYDETIDTIRGIKADIDKYLGIKIKNGRQMVFKRVTMSIGMSTRKEGQTADELVKTADSNTYISKKLGRDKVFVDGVELTVRS